MDILESPLPQAPPRTKVRYGVFVAARAGSSRLPGKALLPLDGVPMLAYLLRRLAVSARAGRIVLATTSLAADDALEAVARREGFGVFRGDSGDLVKRFVDAELAYPCEYAVRVTADCPFVDGATLDHCLAQCDAAPRFDLASTKGRFPVGIDFEIYPASRMRQLHATRTLDAEEREHLTLHLYRHPGSFALLPLHPPAGWTPTDRAFTVDTPDDYRFASRLAAAAGDPAAPVARILAESAR